MKTSHSTCSCLLLTWLAGVILLLIGLPARGASISVGNHLLAANTPNQVISIQVSGGDQIAGEDFFAQIGDGGGFVGGSDTKPIFTKVDILTGTIFAGNNNGAFGDPNGTNPPGSNTAHPLIWVDGTTTMSGAVAADGLLATLTIDTTGLNSGTFPLRLTGVGGALGPFNMKLVDANGDPIPLTVTNGLLMISSFAPGDYNRNGVVDGADYTIWRHTLGQTGASLAADGNGNNQIDAGDYDIWRSHFGQFAGSGSANNFSNLGVPEPMNFVLIVIGAISVTCHRRTFATLF